MPLKYINAYNVDDFSNGSKMLRCSYEEVVICPSCHHAVSPETFTAYYVELDGYIPRRYLLDVICFCPRCRTTFLCKYNGHEGDYNETDIVCSKPFSVSPSTPEPLSFPEEIKSVSPDFVTTYSEASFAESQQLLQICGPGYRKALEFLVKDYLCHLHPDDSEKIRSELLGASIQRIDNTRIKVLAQRSTWIGNDETHYVRKHEDLGLDEMKRFINAMLTYIVSELAFEAAEAISPK